MASTGRKCVLIVDDDDVIREAVCEILRLDGYRVEMANSGLQALAKIRTTRPDAIVLDLMMPVMDGWSFLEQWRTDPLCSDQPVVVMSAHPELEETARALKVQGFLVKPFDLDALLETVKRLLALDVLAFP